MTRAAMRHTSISPSQAFREVKDQLGQQVLRDYKVFRGLRDHKEFKDYKAFRGQQEQQAPLVLGEPPGLLALPASPSRDHGAALSPIALVMEPLLMDPVGSLLPVIST
jgi:hypothetical protein